VMRAARDDQAEFMAALAEREREMLAGLLHRLYDSHTRARRPS
jgi:hypothetical protein